MNEPLEPLPLPTFLAVVCYGDDVTDLGVVVSNHDGTLTALWPDGGADNVYEVETETGARELWDEYGETPFQIPGRDGVGSFERTGTRLHVVSLNPENAPAGWSPVPWRTP